MNEDAKLLTQALAALVLLVDGDHDKDCRYQNTPINECPTCSGRHTKIAREAIKALTKRVAVYTAAPSPQAQEQIVNMGTPVEKLFAPAPSTKHQACRCNEERGDIAGLQRNRNSRQPPVL